MTAPSSSIVFQPPFQAPFTPIGPVCSAQDVLALTQTPLAQALTVSSTYAIMRNSAHAFGNKTALTFLPDASTSNCQPIRWSYSQLFAKINQTANALNALGVRPTDAVAVLLPGCLEYQLALWGGSAAGIVQPLNPLLSDEKLISLMNAGKATVLIAWGSDTESTIWSKTLRIFGQVPTLRTVLRVAPLDEPTLPPFAQGVQDFATLCAQQNDSGLDSGRQITSNDIAAYFHTGGTTGAPKLARHSHGAQVFSAWASVQLQGVTPRDVTLNGYPLFHVAGVLPVSLASLSAGMEIVIPTHDLFRNKAVIANYWRLVAQHRVTVVSAVPTVLAALCDVPVAGADISSLRYCRTGAAPLSPELAKRFKTLFGLHVHESYGMTETAGIATITPPGVEGAAGSVGFALPYAHIRIVKLDAQGGASQEEVGPGEAGVVLIKAPNVFSGFLDAQDNQYAFTADGWLITGDLGFMDAQQTLHLSGRSKDLIIRSGHNIDPKTIEDALSEHPAVALCAAVGAPDRYAGELPVVFATLTPGAQATEAELLDFVRAHVDEPPARPRSVTILAVMPMTNVGKIFKPELRELAAAAVALEQGTESTKI